MILLLPIVRTGFIGEVVYRNNLLSSSANSAHHSLDLIFSDVSDDGFTWYSEKHVYTEGVVWHVFPVDNQQRQHSSEVYEYNYGMLESLCHCEADYDFNSDGELVVLHATQESKIDER